jgi:hypothetical protein
MPAVSARPASSWRGSCQARRQRTPQPAIRRLGRDPETTEEQAWTKVCLRLLRSFVADLAPHAQDTRAPRMALPQAKGPLGEIVGGAVGAATGTIGRHLGRRGTAESSRICHTRALPLIAVRGRSARRRGTITARGGTLCGTSPVSGGAGLPHDRGDCGAAHPSCRGNDRISSADLVGL